MNNFISLDTFASVVKISRQAAWKACKKQTWRKHKLEVRLISGQGGNNGKQYQVKVSSLPPIFQDRLKSLQSSFEDTSNMRFGDKAQSERNWKYDVIRKILEHPRNSCERVQAIEALAGTSRINWKGRQQKLSRTSLYKWVSLYEEKGIVALARTVRSDKGARKVFISHDFMRIVKLEMNIKEIIHNDIKNYIRSLIKGGARRKQVFVLAEDKLKKMCAAYGFKVNNSFDEQKAFKLPHGFITAEMHYRKVYDHKYDRKKSEDNSPRIKRTIKGLLPMEIVVVDIHHMNITVQRENGTYSTPKLIAFHDIATDRVFCEIIQFENKGGVRNVDVITAFVNMCMDKAFGIPQHIYADNGSEYNFLDFLEDALKLNVQLHNFNSDSRSKIIRATPYNAAAKHVEGWFKQVNQQIFRAFNGYIGDDRMKPLTPALGKKHKPYDKGFDQFCCDVKSALSAFNKMPKQGQLKGRSPDEAFQSFVEKGWQATLLNPEQLLNVFVKQERRIPHKGAISIKGQKWTCDGLIQTYDREVIAHVPLYHGFSSVRITRLDGTYIGDAQADRTYHVLDQRRAKESARRKRLYRQGIQALGNIVPKVELLDEIIAYGQERPDVVPNTPENIMYVDTANSNDRFIPPQGEVTENAKDAPLSIDEQIILLKKMSGYKG